MTAPTGRPRGRPRKVAVSSDSQAAAGSPVELICPLMKGPCITIQCMFWRTWYQIPEPRLGCALLTHTSASVTTTEIPKLTR